MCANHSLQSYFFQREFFGELRVFRHLNMDFTIFFNVIFSDFNKLSLSFKTKHNCETCIALSACYNNKHFKLTAALIALIML